MALVLVVAVGVVFAVLPASTSAAKTGSKPKTVEIVGPDGTPLNVVNGAIGIQAVPPTLPLHFQTTLSAPALSGVIANVLTHIPINATVSISSITVTCMSCSGAAGPGGANPILVQVEDINMPDCSTTTAGAQIMADIQTNTSEPSVDFTFPTPRAAPLGFTPTGQWCIQVYAGGAGTAAQAFVTIDGSQQ